MPCRPRSCFQRRPARRSRDYFGMNVQRLFEDPGARRPGQAAGGAQRDRRAHRAVRRVLAVGRARARRGPAADGLAPARPGRPHARGQRPALAPDHRQLHELGVELPRAPVRAAGQHAGLGPLRDRARQALRPAAPTGDERARALRRRPLGDLERARPRAVLAPEARPGALRRPLPRDPRRDQGRRPGRRRHARRAHGEERAGFHRVGGGRAAADRRPGRRAPPTTPTATTPPMCSPGSAASGACSTRAASAFRSTSPRPAGRRAASSPWVDVARPLPERVACRAR